MQDNNKDNQETPKDPQLDIPSVANQGNTSIFARKKMLIAARLLTSTSNTKKQKNAGRSGTTDWKKDGECAMTRRATLVSDRRNAREPGALSAAESEGCQHDSLCRPARPADVSTFPTTNCWRLSVAARYRCAAAV